jgi:hypothetical protein
MTCVHAYTILEKAKYVCRPCLLMLVLHFKSFKAVSVLPCEIADCFRRLTKGFTSTLKKILATTVITFQFHSEVQ